LAAVREALSTSRLVTLTGIGGVGKTRLALRATHTIRRAFSDGVWLVELAGVSDCLLVPQKVSSALGIVDQTARDQVQVLSEFVADRHLLLVMDNCEHLVPAVAMLVTNLLPAAPGLRVLTTSRESLGVFGERLVDVAPLPVPDRGESVTAAGTMRYPALTLFGERAAAASPGFEITDVNVGLVAQVCRQLDGIPLAIELAAARMRELSLDQVAARLGDRFALLRAKGPTTPRHQTLLAAVEWSFELCAKPERVLWVRASVFAGSFDLAGMQRVCYGGDLPAEVAIEVVAGLVDKSVLIVDDTPGARRYRMLDTIREFGLNRLRHPHLDDDSVGDEDTLRAGFRNHYLDLAERFHADWFGPRQPQWSQRMRAELANLRAALDWCLRTPGESRAGLQLAGALHYLWYACGHAREGGLWLERMLAAEPNSSLYRMRARGAHLRLLLLQGEHGVAADLARQYLQRNTGFEDAAWMSDALIVLGYDRLYANDTATGIRLLKEAVSRAVDLGAVHPQVAYANVALALGYLTQGDRVKASDLLAEGRAICRAYGDQWYLSQILMVSAQYAANLTEAAAYARESLTLQRSLNDILGALGVLEVMAPIASADHDHRRAARLLGAADQLRHMIGGSPYDAQRLAWRQQTTAAARSALGDTAFDAEHHHGQGLTVDEAISYALGERKTPETAKALVVGETTAVILTRREREITELVARGLSNRQIAERLVISQRTAESHVGNILDKLGFTSRSQIASWHTSQGGHTDDPPR
jgi:predicted ATPase/DNA-binding CsgD family transcriptional regulator